MKKLILMMFMIGLLVSCSVEGPVYPSYTISSSSAYKPIIPSSSSHYNPISSSSVTYITYYCQVVYAETRITYGCNVRSELFVDNMPCEPLVNNSQCNLLHSELIEHSSSSQEIVIPKSSSSRRIIKSSSSKSNITTCRQSSCYLQCRHKQTSSGGSRGTGGQAACDQQCECY